MDENRWTNTMLKVNWLFVYCLRGNQTFLALCVQKFVVLLSSAGDKSVAPIKCPVKVCLTSLTVTSNNTELAIKAISGLLVINHCLTVVNRGGKTMSPWLLLWRLRLPQCVPYYWEMWGYRLIITLESWGRNLALSSRPVCYHSVVMFVLQRCSQIRLTQCLWNTLDLCKAGLPPMGGPGDTAYLGAGEPSLGAVTAPPEVNDTTPIDWSVGVSQYVCSVTGWRCFCLLTKGTGTGW